MDKKYILKALRPLKLKIFFHRAIEVFLYALTATGIISLVLVLASMLYVIPFVRHKMLVIIGVGLYIALNVSLFFIPAKKQLIMTADSLGLKERIITAWYLMGDNSEVAMLQRQDTKRALESTNLASAYRIRVDKRLYITAACLVITAFLLTFIPGRVHGDTVIRESLIQKMKESEKQIEDEIKSQKQKNPEISDEQMEQLKEALEKLKGEFRKAKSEEDALKALAQMENQLDNLKRQDPLRGLKTLENVLNNSQLTRDIAEALAEKDGESLREALEKLAEEPDNDEKIKELAEMLKQAAMNMGDNSMLSDALQNLAASAGSGEISGNELVQSLMELIQQAEENAAGQQDFENALGDVGNALGNARRSISAVDRRVASGNTGRMQRQPGESGNNNGSDEGGQQPGNNSGSQGGNQNRNQAGNEGGGMAQNGSSGNNQQMGGESGGGAGEGSTGTDMGYSDGEQSGGRRAPGEWKEEDYKRIYVPEHLGGEGNEITLSGRVLDSGSSTYSEADGAPVKKGAMVPYREVLSEYRTEAVQSMEKQDIPSGMKELVKSYFSSLD